MRRIYSMIAFLLLIACGAPVPEVTSGSNIHTGRSFVFAKPQRVYRDTISVFYASPAIEHDGDHTRYRILTSISRNDLNYPKITEAWSLGTRLQYRKDDRRRNFCHPICDREETGFVNLSRTDFEALARTGFAFQLLGKRGVYEGVIPAQAFQTALVMFRE